jgi:hypothetical protein
MRKGITESSLPTTRLTLESLEKMEQAGYKYVQVKGFTSDKHYDYVEPSFLLLVPMKELPLLLVPMKELPKDQQNKDIYEPLSSGLLQQWANDETAANDIVIATYK